MLLGARFLTNVVDVNTFKEVAVPELYAGDLQVVGVQLVDLQQGCGDGTVWAGGSTCGSSRGGRRYVPAAGATLSVILDSVDDAKRLTKVATQPFAGDPSIWTFTIGTADGVRGTITVLLALTEPGGVVHRAVLNGALRVRLATG